MIETWLVKKEDIHRLEHNEMRMVRWIRNATLRDRILSAE